MKIYEVKCAVNDFQSFYTEDRSTWSMDTLQFDATPKATIWVPPAVYVGAPKQRRGNSVDLCAGAFAVDTVARAELLDLFEMSGELLPLPHQTEVFYVLNVTECPNVLDDDNTIWEYGKTTGAKIRIVKYAFHEHRMTEAPLFKIPETCRGTIYTFEGLKDPGDEFKPRVEEHGLTGLTFNEVWDSEA